MHRGSRLSVDFKCIDMKCGAHVFFSVIFTSRLSYGKDMPLDVRAHFVWVFRTRLILKERRSTKKLTKNLELERGISAP